VALLFQREAQNEKGSKIGKRPDITISNRPPGFSIPYVNSAMIASTFNQAAMPLKSIFCAQSRSKSFKRRVDNLQRNAGKPAPSQYPKAGEVEGMKDGKESRKCFTMIPFDGSEVNF
jgi:hypothetical protein